MSANPEIHEIVELPVQNVAAPVEQPLVEAPLEAPLEAPPAPLAAPRRARPAWAATAALGVVALVAAGSLGYVAYAASQQRDAVQARLVTTTATLVSTQDQLSSAQADARSKKVTADYVAMYVADEGRVETDYQVLGACNSFSACRTGSQQLLDDLQKFQSDRGGVTVPEALSSGDASLGDALSAAIAADQEIISGMDGGSVSKFKDGFNKLDAAMLSVGKAGASLGGGLK
jgi:hypothetical protein